MRALTVYLCLCAAVAATVDAAGSPLWEDVIAPNRPYCDLVVGRAEALLVGRGVDRQQLLEVGLADLPRRCGAHRKAQALLGELRIAIGDFAGARQALERAALLELTTP